MKSFSRLLPLVPLLACAPATQQVSRASTIFERVEGQWGWIADGLGCRDNPHTIAFTADRRQMIFSYPRDTARGRETRYEIRAYDDSTIRGFIASPPETRRTLNGDLVVWDLVLVAPDVYHWHRTDWPPGGYTRAIVRCGTLRAQASDPEGTARVVLEAIAAGQWLLAAEHTDPAELRRNRQAFDSLLSADSLNYLAKRIFDIDSTAQLRRLSDAEFTARLFAFQTDVRTDQSFRRTVRGAITLGSVRRGDDTAHVVYRWRFPRDSLPLRSASVHTMVHRSGRWWSQMLGDYSGLVRVLKEPMVPVPVPSPARPRPRT